MLKPYKIWNKTNLPLNDIANIIEYVKENDSFIFDDKLGEYYFRITYVFTNYDVFVINKKTQINIYIKRV